MQLDANIVCGHADSNYKPRETNRNNPSVCCSASGLLTSDSQALTARAEMKYLHTSQYYYLEITF